jgi:hypothetical protein
MSNKNIHNKKFDTKSTTNHKSEETPIHTGAIHKQRQKSNFKNVKPTSTSLKNSIDGE